MKNCFLLSVLMIQFIIPLISATSLNAQSDNLLGAEYMVICTADGLKTVRVDQETEASSQEKQIEHCFSCRIALLGFSLPNADELVVDLVAYESVVDTVQFENWVIPQGHIVTSHTARAPPQII